MALVDAKYSAGYRKHGGQLWEHPALLGEAINEVIDLAVYLLTLKEQLNAAKPVEESRSERRAKEIDVVKVLVEGA